ncbi:O-acetyl-ADP-ribose deacetylase (regulator of RNase III), contains Macro domain [Lachnospiraceae bacterium XPB1003]|nr:O-acetyl-ADP-ribose deacetylase (regulator of RNase III), contains Macro domain [Lachnospiraceae bacterium XPB1003]
MAKNNHAPSPASSDVVVIRNYPASLILPDGSVFQSVSRKGKNIEGRQNVLLGDPEQVRNVSLQETDGKVQQLLALQIKSGKSYFKENKGDLLGCFSPLHNCADNIIHSKAGLSLRFKCNCIMRAQGHEEPTGKAKITPAYNLPFKYVIHTVGPIVQGSLTKRHEDLLASCYRSCLDIAEENNVESIALCCISTGVFMFPNQMAAEIAVDTVKAWLTETGSQMKVVFYVYKDLDLEILLLAKNEKMLKMANRNDRTISSNRRREMDIMRLIPRNSYMEKIINVIGTPDIKVITGVRRCGKSKLLESFKKYIDENIQDANIIHINFNLPEFEEEESGRPVSMHRRKRT